MSADNLQNLIETYVIPWGISGVQALIVFMIGKWIVSKFSMLVGKTLRHSKMDEMLVDFVESLMGWALKLVVVGNLAAKFGYEVKRNSDVPVGTDKTDTMTTVTLGYAF